MRNAGSDAAWNGQRRAQAHLPPSRRGARCMPGNMAGAAAARGDHCGMLLNNWALLRARRFCKRR